MKLPNATRAVIVCEKLRDYLLNPKHRRGASKAKLLLSMGYEADRWQRLETDLREQHLAAEVKDIEATDYGTSYVIVAPLAGPNGRRVSFRSIWQVDRDSVQPRFITMYPEKV